MKVGYAVLYDNGELVISKNHTLLLLQKKIIKDYGKFYDTNVPWLNEPEQIGKVQILNQVKVSCMKEWFKDCINLKTLIDFQNLDTSDCTDFSFMFSYCESLQNLNGLENWNVSNGTDFSGMFFDCKSLQTLTGLESWNVSNGTDFSYMFSCCKSLQNLNGLENWNVSDGTNFFNMFSCCKSLQHISLSNTLDILRKNMFNKCNLNLKIKWKNHFYTYADLAEYNQIC